VSFEIKEIRELAKKVSLEEMGAPSLSSSSTGENLCLGDESSEKVIAELAMAQFIISIRGKGMTLADSLRLRRLRSLQENSD